MASATLSTESDQKTRKIVRTTAGKVLRSDDLIGTEKDVAAGILRAHPELGNPHVVRCNWCRETRILFRDENEEPFKLTQHGWSCGACDVNASCQEIKL